jgi:hypothetical protein
VVSRAPGAGCGDTVPRCGPAALAGDAKQDRAPRTRGAQWPPRPPGGSRRRWQHARASALDVAVPTELHGKQQSGAGRCLAVAGRRKEQRVGSMRRTDAAVPSRMVGSRCRSGSGRSLSSHAGDPRVAAADTTDTGQTLSTTSSRVSPPPAREPTGLGRTSPPRGNDDDTEQDFRYLMLNGMRVDPRGRGPVRTTSTSTTTSGTRE